MYNTPGSRIRGEYSSTYDLCLIFVNIHQQVYSGNKVTNQTLVDIAEQLRRWDSLFLEGSQTDEATSPDFFADNGVPWPNIGPYHLKEAYYWSIMLLTLPLLIDYVTKCLRKNRGSKPGPDDTASTAPPTLSLPVSMCVNAAIAAIEMLGRLFTTDRVLPRRLPFVVNTAFYSATILGISVFGDVDVHFPLERHFGTAQSLLSRLSASDPVARQSSLIISELRQAFDQYLARRRQRQAARRASFFAGLFGDLETNRDSWREAARGHALLHDHSLPDSFQATQ
jgi:hypothetical protein